MARTHRSDGPLIPGRHHSGNRGRGVLGADVPSGGTDGPSYLYPSLDLPADLTVEVRGVIETMPVGFTSFVANEDGSFTLGGPDGTYTWVVRGYAAGVDKGTFTASAVIGTVAATCDVVGSAVTTCTATGGVVVVVPTLVDLAGSAVVTCSAVGAVGVTTSEIVTGDLAGLAAVVCTAVGSLVGLITNPGAFPSAVSGERSTLYWQAVPSPAWAKTQDEVLDFTCSFVAPLAEVSDTVLFPYFEAPAEVTVIAQQVAEGLLSVLLGTTPMGVYDLVFTIDTMQGRRFVKHVQLTVNT